MRHFSTTTRDTLAAVTLAGLTLATSATALATATSSVRATRREPASPKQSRR